MSTQPELKLTHKGRHKKIIIFVHGLWGDPKTSFADWPDFIAKDEKEVRGQLALSTYAVATLGYPAKMGDRLSLREVQTRLLKELEDKGIFDDYEQIFFICHSLGGLVIKGLLIDLKMESSEYFQKIAAIFLIATPSQGAPLTNWISALLQIIVGRLVVDIQTKDSNTYLQKLEEQWLTILRKRENQFPLPHIYGAYEKKAFKGLKIAVQEIYTATFYDEPPIAINADHIEIVKPKSPDDSIYTWVQGRIAALQKELGSIERGFIVKNKFTKPIPSSTPKLSLSQKMQIVEALLECPSIEFVLDKLSIKQYIDSSDILRHHVMNVVETCLNHKGGMAELVNLLHSFDNNTKAIDNLDALLEQQFPELLES